MAALIYVLCALTSLACAWLVLRSYVRYWHRLMFWAGLCFCGLFISNALLVVDQLVVPQEDLSTLRLLAALVALLPLLYGLIWEEE